MQGRKTKMRLRIRTFLRSGIYWLKDSTQYNQNISFLWKNGKIEINFFWTSGDFSVHANYQLDRFQILKTSKL